MNQQVVAGCGMVDLSLIDAVNNHLSWVAITLHDLDCLLVNAICHEIFSESTVVTVFHFRLSLLQLRRLFFLRTLIVKVFNIDVVDIA